MLQFIGGLGPRKAGVVQRAIQSAGRLRTRKDLFMTLKVMGKKVFINSAGFIRVCGSGEAASETQDLNPLDDTRIHPESYQVSLLLLLTHTIHVLLSQCRVISGHIFSSAVFHHSKLPCEQSLQLLGRSQTNLKMYITEIFRVRSAHHRSFSPTVFNCLREI